MRTESTLRHVTENIRDVFYITEMAFYRIVYVSPAYETIWQASREELYEGGQAWLKHVHPDDLPAVSEGLAKQAETGTYDLEYRIVLPDKKIRWIHARSYPIFDSLERLIRVAGIAEDVTPSKTAAQYLSERPAAEAQARARSRALATVAHELRNPLNCAGLALHRLRNPKLTDIDREAIHGKLEHLVGRMEQLIENIMDMSRCESGGMVLNPRPVKVLTLLRDAVESFPPEARKRGVGLRLTHALDPNYGVGHRCSALDAGGMQPLLVASWKHIRGASGSRVKWVTAALFSCSCQNRLPTLTSMFRHHLDDGAAGELAWR